MVHVVEMVVPMFFHSALRRFLLLCGLAFCASVHADSPVFRLGIAPHTSARVILEMYQPLRLHLEKALGMPVEVVTAPDFTEFARRMLHQDYDMAVTTGHQARLAQLDASYTPLQTYSADFRAVALVAGAGSIKTASDLKGKTVLGLSSTSLVTLWGQHWLAKNGVNQPMRYVSASDSVAQLVLEGRADAGFTSLANYQSLPREVQSRLRFMVISEPMAGRVYLLNQQQLPRKAAVDAALAGFASSVEGKTYFAKYKLDGVRNLKPGELQAMDIYAVEVRQTLK
jgi:phosphonate transport system substrate-binding protein